MIKLTKPHLCCWITFNAGNQTGVYGTWFTVCPLNCLLLEIIYLGLDQRLKQLVLMQMLTPNVDDHVLLGVDCNPDVALLVPALVESEHTVPERWKML